MSTLPHCCVQSATLGPYCSKSAWTLVMWPTSRRCAGKLLSPTGAPQIPHQAARGTPAAPSAACKRGSCDATCLRHTQAKALEGQSDGGGGGGCAAPVDAVAATPFGVGFPTPAAARSPSAEIGPPTEAAGATRGTSTTPGGRFTMRTVPSTWLKATAPVAKVHVCQNFSSSTTVPSGTRAASSAKCFGPKRWSPMPRSGQTMHLHPLTSPLAANTWVKRAETLTIFSFQFLCDHRFGQCCRHPAGFTATDAGLPPRSHTLCSGKSCNARTSEYSVSSGTSRNTWTSPSRWLYRVRPPTTSVSCHSSSRASS
mmetsp:Transcript_23482/g.67968  ORF Transcript_23482/g.67968 Transcript_23482/m.67968 type:complete len:312 (+) Transcript_23482:271-1206(+)